MRCPNCKTEQSRRKDGCCPHCGAEVEILKGRWVLAGSGSPNMQLIRHFETLVSGQLTQNTGRPTIWRMPAKADSFRRELAAAADLIALAENDLDLARGAVSLLFQHPRWAWKSFSTLMGSFRRDYTQALAVVQAERQQQDAEQQARQKYLDQLRSRPNPFH